MMPLDTISDVAILRGQCLLRELANEHLSVAIAPTLGGKIVSLRSIRTGTEWLLPPLRPYAEARSTAGFELGDCGGFDECLPTVSASGDAPDHGELWRSAWEETKATCVIDLHTLIRQGSVAMRRRAWLDGPALVLDYTVKNTGKAPQSLLYSAHPLLRVEAGDRVELPAEVQSVRVEGSRADRLGKSGDSLDWPLRKHSEGGLEDLSLVGPPDGLQADKLFAGPLQSGWCRLVRPSLGEGIAFSFDADVLPYVGMWISRAAWPETGTARQYTVALEPTNARCDALADAEKEGTAWQLAPGQERAWTLRLTLTHLIEHTAETATRGAL